MGVIFGLLIFALLVISWLWFIEIDGVKIIKTWLYFRWVDKQLRALEKSIGFTKYKGFISKVSTFDCYGITYKLDDAHYVSIVGYLDGFNTYTQNETNNPDVEFFDKFARSLTKN